MSTDLELASLTECEQVIERGLATFVEVGQALVRIRDGKLYRREHPTFEAYCQHRWGFDRTYAHRLIESAKVRQVLSIDNSPAPANVAQSRELAPLLDKPDDLRATWQEAVERSNGEVPTAAVVREVREERAEYEAKATPEPRQAPRKQLPDQFSRAVHDLTKAAERVARLAADDRLARNAQQIAAKNRGDLLRAVAVLEDALQRLSIQQ